jgi:hypothetical protein
VELVPAEQGIGLDQEFPGEKVSERYRQPAGPAYRLALQPGQCQAGSACQDSQRLRDRSDHAQVRAGADNHGGTRGAQPRHRLAEQLRRHPRWDPPGHVIAADHDQRRVRRIDQCGVDLAA